MKIGEIISELERWAPLSYQEGYDNAGLIVGDRSSECTGALIALDCIESVVDEADKLGYNLIIAHHPILFRGLKSLTGKDYVERTVIKAIKKDIAVYAIHTNLDNVHNGVNLKIANLLGLKQQRVLLPKRGTLMKLVTFVPTDATQTVLDAIYSAGAGAIGEYDHCSFRVVGMGTFRPSVNANPHIGQKQVDESVQEQRIEVIFDRHRERAVLSALRKSHPYEEVAYYLTSLENENQEVGSGRIGQLEEGMPFQQFMDFVKQTFGLECIRYTDPHTDLVRNVAVCGGAGSFLIHTAASQGADVLITADLKYHEFFDADGKITILDIGHYESEAFTKELIYEFLKEKFANIALRLSDVYTNPIKYF